MAGRENEYGIYPLNFHQTPIISHSVPYSSSGDGPTEFFTEVGGGNKDGAKSEFLHDDVTYHDKKAK